MSQERIDEARALIKAKKYAEARAILTAIDHPTAAKWLAKLDEIAPEEAPAPKAARSMAELAARVPRREQEIEDSFDSDASPAESAPVVGITPREKMFVAGSLIFMMVVLTLILVFTMVGSGSGGSVATRWKYMLVEYSQPNFYSERLQTTIPQYEKQFEVPECGELDFTAEVDCEQKNYKGLAYFLEIFSQDGWELVSTNDKSGTEEYAVALFFRKPL